MLKKEKLVNAWPWALESTCISNLEQKANQVHGFESSVHAFYNSFIFTVKLLFGS